MAGEGARFYESLGFEEQSPAHRFRLPVPAGEAPGDTDGDLTAHFLEVAAVAATAVAGVVGELADREPVGTGADGGPTEAADRAAEEAAVHHLSRLGVPIVSEESGLVGETAHAAGQPWISLDPLDGSRNLRCGLPPTPRRWGWWATGGHSPAWSATCRRGDAGGRPRPAVRSWTAARPGPGAARWPSFPARDGAVPSRPSTATTVYGCRVARPSTSAGWPTVRRRLRRHRSGRGPRARPGRSAGRAATGRRRGAGARWAHAGPRARSEGDLPRGGRRHERRGGKVARAAPPPVTP